MNFDHFLVGSINLIRTCNKNCEQAILCHNEFIGFVFYLINFVVVLTNAQIFSWTLVAFVVATWFDSTAAKYLLTFDRQSAPCTFHRNYSACPIPFNWKASIRSGSAHNKRLRLRSRSATSSQQQALITATRLLHPNKKNIMPVGAKRRPAVSIYPLQTS